MGDGSYCCIVLVHCHCGIGLRGIENGVKTVIALAQCIKP